LSWLSSSPPNPNKWWNPSFLLLCVLEPGTAMDRLVLAQLTQLYMTVKLECPFYGVNMHCFYWPIDGYVTI
jgi:hypothetical protein